MDARVAVAQPRVIHIDGVFDAEAAERLARELASAGESEMHVDLTHVREFHDSGVAILARELARHAKTTVSGLSQHHVRLLRYLGIDTGAVDLAEPVELT